MSMPMVSVLETSRALVRRAIWLQPRNQRRQQRDIRTPLRGAPARSAADVPSGRTPQADVDAHPGLWRGIHGPPLGVQRPPAFGVAKNHPARDVMQLRI